MKTIKTIDVKKIKKNPFQPRTKFEKKQLKMLAHSIKEVGIKNPIQVRQEKDGSFTLKDGDRRIRACEMAGIKRLKIGKDIIIVEATDKDLMVDSIILNCLRQDLHPIDKGRALMTLFGTIGIKDINIAQNCLHRYHNQTTRGKLTKPSSRNFFVKEEVILKLGDYLKMLGVSENTASMLLSITTLPEVIQEGISPSTERQQFSPREFIGIRQAYQISRVKDKPFQMYLFKNIKKKGWGIVYVRKLVDDFVETKLNYKEYMDYWAKKKKKKEDIGLTELAKNCFRFASTLRSFRCLNLVALSQDLTRKEFVFGLHDLRNGTIDLKGAIEDRIFSTAELVRERKKEKKETMSKPFEVLIRVAKKKKMVRFTIPMKIVKKLGLKDGDKVHLKVVAFEREETKYRGKVI